MSWDRVHAKEEDVIINHKKSVTHSQSIYLGNLCMDFMLATQSKSNLWSTSLLVSSNTKQGLFLVQALNQQFCCKVLWQYCVKAKKTRRTNVI